MTVLRSGDGSCVLARNWLHRERLTFQDLEGEICEVVCAFPEDLQRSLDIVRSSQKHGGARFFTVPASL